MLQVSMYVGVQEYTMHAHQYDRQDNNTFSGMSTTYVKVLY